MPSGITVAIAAFLFAAIFLVRVADRDAGDATLVLFVLPIALCAIEFGVRGGLAAALVALVLLAGWEVMSHSDVKPLGVATRATAYFLLGGLLGRLVDERGALQAELARHYDLSRDLFCTARFDGRFERLNQAWQKTLGYTEDELCSRPFVEFVHPDDRERTGAEAAKLAEQGTDTVSFRNRYRTAQGDYRWLEWNAHAVADEQRIYATARDITIQQKAEQALEEAATVLERAVRDRTEALQEARLEMLLRLAVAAEYRDDDTHQHTERVGRTAALIAQELELSDDAVTLIRHAAPLHDIGKLGVSDSILLKPGKLTPAEFELVKEHVNIGCKILAEGKFEVLRLAQEIALSHHERWDGTGYPNRQHGEEIPLSGRIVAVADVFDALTHARPYKGAWAVDDAVAEVTGLAGQHFDPRVVEAFAALDHRSLLDPVEHYDLDLPAPPLTAPTESESIGAPTSAMSTRGGLAVQVSSLAARRS